MVNILLDPVICWFNFKKCPINRRNSFRFMLSISDIGTKRSKPNSRLKQKTNENNIIIFTIIALESKT